jgi:DNA recombination protein RmuC
MSQIFLFIILAVIVAGFAAVIFYLNQRLRELKNASAVEMVKSDVTELTRSIGLLQQSMGDKLERGNASMQQSVQRQLSESAKLVADVTQRLTKLDETNRRVVDVAD